MTEKNKTVVDALRQNIGQLEEAIDDVNRVRKDLFQNAHQVKSHIHSTVSRELEALRNREVWLLTQVDLVHNVKEDVLSAQQARINKALGSAQTGLQYTQRDPDSGTDIEDDMERLELNELKPEESPKISFQADAAGLRDSIMSFGRLEMGGKSLQKVFADSNTLSASLPNPYEDYDDVEHHMLYKTVEEVKRVKNDDASIMVNIPKLNLKVDDWLIKPVEAGSSREGAATKPPVTFPAWSTNMEDWLLPQGGGASKDKQAGTGGPKHCLSRDSIQDWLLQIKQFPNAQDEEGEEFEIVERLTISDGGGDSGMDGTFSSTLAMTTPSYPINPLPFTQVNSNTMHAWLQGGTACPSTSKLQHEELFCQLKHTPADTHGWLVTKESCTTNCRKVEIEDLGSFPCLADRYMFKHLPSEQDRWLFHETKTTIERAAPSAFLCAKMPPVSDVCRANEQCGDYSNCVCSPSCGAECIMNTDNSMWLLMPKSSKNRCASDFQVVTFSHIQKMSSNPSDWLNRAVSRKSSMDIATDNRFTGLEFAGKLTSWLMCRGSVDSISSESSSSHTNLCLNSIHNDATDMNVWLLKPSATTTDNNPTMPSSSPFANYDVFQKSLGVSAWLVQHEYPMEVDEIDADAIEEEKRDTTTEKMDCSKWLLHGDNQREEELEPKIPRKIQKLQSGGSGKPGFGEWLFDKCL